MSLERHVGELEVHQMEDVAKVFQEIERSRDELITFLKELVRIPTVNPPGENYPECVRLISDKLKKIGMDLQLVDVPKERLSASGVELQRPSIIGVLKGDEGKPSLHINGHYDVVPVGSGWTVDPFGGEVREGKLYGRGATDMKAGITAAVIAALAVARSGVRLRGDLVISSTPDEETGGELGAGYIVAKGYARGDAAIVAECPGVDKVCIAHKGALWMELKTIGKAAHSGRPHLGVNAVTKMAKLVLALDRFAEELQTRRTASSSLFGDAPSPVLVVGGTIQGGVKTNIIPDSCVVTLDRRLLLEEKLEDAEYQIMSVVAKTKGEDPEFRVQSRPLLRIPPAQCPREAKVVTTLVKAVTKVYGTAPNVAGNYGFTDAHYFMEKMPTVMWGPNTTGRGHSADEYVIIDDVVRAAKVFTLAAIEMLS